LKQVGGVFNVDCEYQVSHGKTH